MATYNINYELYLGTNNPNNPSTYSTDNLPLTIQAPTKSGYTFVGWATSRDTTPELNYTIQSGTTGNLTLYAYFSPANRRTLHLWEREDNPGNYSLHEAEVFEGVPGQYTNAQPKHYSGFVCVGNTAAKDGTITQKIIAADGSTYVRIYYDRVSTTGGIIIDGQPLSKRYINGQEVQKVMVNGSQVRPTS